MNVLSVSTLFALNTVISIKHGNHKKLTRYPAIGNKSIQRVIVEESSRHKWVKAELTNCSWRLMETVSMAIGTEVRAKYNYHVSQGKYGDHMGVSCFSPMVNMMRHPLWGRNQVSTL